MIVGRTVYGCTFAYLHHGIGEFGVKVRHVDLNDAMALKAAITAKTRMIYFETPANPNMQLVDIAAVAEAVRGMTCMSWSTTPIARPTCNGH